MADHNHNHDHGDHHHEHSEPKQEVNEPVNEGAESLAGALRFLFVGLRVAMLILVVLLFRTGCFTVKPTEQVLTFRFGELLEDASGESALSSGDSKAYWVWPRPVGDTLSLDSKSLPLSVETTRFWHEKVRSMVSQPGEDLRDSEEPIALGKDGYVLTGDSYMFHIKATMTYYITDAKQFYLSFYKTDDAGNFDEKSSRELASKIIKSHLDQAIAMESTSWKVDDAFYDDIDQYRADLLQKAKADVSKLEYGITIDRIDIKAEDRKPLAQIRATFSNVRRAEADARRQINDATKAGNTIKLNAANAATLITTGAEVYRQKIVSRLENLKKLDNQGNTDLVYLYLEAMDNILQNVDYRFVIRKDEKGNDTYWLKLGPEKRQSGDK
jgi:regulator of protease activity HflC (stomatin/prohibitin superfamily)